MSSGKIGIASFSMSRKVARCRLCSHIAFLLVVFSVAARFAFAEAPGHLVLNYSYLPNSSSTAESGTVQIPLNAKQYSAEMRGSLYALNAGLAIQQFLSDWHHKKLEPVVPATEFQLNALVNNSVMETSKPTPEAVNVQQVPDYTPATRGTVIEKREHEDKKHSRGKSFAAAVRQYAENLDKALRKEERERGPFEHALQDQFQRLNVDLLSLAATFENPVHAWTPPTHHYPPHRLILNGKPVYPPNVKSVPRFNHAVPGHAPGMSAGGTAPRSAPNTFHGSSAPHTMALTSGGVMTDKGFWAKVSSRHIPELADFHLDGYLKRFRLQLTTAPEADGKHLAIAMGEGLYFPATGKILVQVSMAALADEQTYKRPPLNLVVGIDISGSMSTVDAVGGGLTRMDGAKQATIEMLKKLRPDDRLAIFVFDDVVEMLVRPTSISSPEALETIIAKVNTLKPRHLTDIGRAQELAAQIFKEMSADEQKGREPAQNRFVLVTDAMVTHGELNEEELRKKARSAATDHNYTTVVGVGRGFSRSLSEKLASETGGMFFYADSGEELVKLFRNFDTRMITFATNFKVSIKPEGIPGPIKLAAVFGSGITDPHAALKPGDPLDDKTVLEVPTLAFADLQSVDPAAGGGAFLIELDVTPKP